MAFLQNKKENKRKEKRRKGGEERRKGGQLSQLHC